MIVWLASYPRSGNTFVRILLRQGFGLKTYSLHQGDDKDFGDEKLSDIVGHTTAAPEHDLVSEARASSELYVIKTHQPPLTDDPAIYIVRDGRSATVSYFHYVNEGKEFKIPMEAMIDGNDFSGSWSGHYAAWEPLKRPNTLLLRYEEITRDPETAIEVIGEFLKLKGEKTVPKTFSDLQQTAPKFFRAGSDEKNIAEMTPYLGRFAAHHGRLMVELGYMRDDEVRAHLDEYVKSFEAVLALKDSQNADLQGALAASHDHRAAIENAWAADRERLSDTLADLEAGRQQTDAAWAVVRSEVARTRDLELRLQSSDEARLAVQRRFLDHLMNRPFASLSQPGRALYSALGQRKWPGANALSDTEVTICSDAVMGVLQ